MTKKIKIALGLIGGIALASAIAPIAVSCSNDNGSNGNNNPNGPGGSTDNGTGNIVKPEFVYKPTGNQSQIISEQQLNIIKKNLMDNCIVATKGYERVLIDTSINSYLKSIKLVDNKLTFTIYLELKNSRNHSTCEDTWTLMLNPNSEGKYELRQDFLMSENGKKQNVQDVGYLNKAEFDLWISYRLKNNSSYTFSYNSISNNNYLDNNFINEQNKINEIINILMDKFYGNNDWPYNYSEFNFHQKEISLNFYLYNRDVTKGKAIKYRFRSIDTNTWQLEFYSYTIDFFNPPTITPKIKRITQEQLVSFFNEIYTNKRLLSFDEIGTNSPVK